MLHIEYRNFTGYFIKNGILFQKKGIPFHKKWDFIFQWDNDPKHNSKLALEFYKKNKFDSLEWPPYSPDLNPIENIWGIVKQEVNKYDLLKISDVIAKVKTVWSEIDQEMIKHCIENMPIRLNKWIESSGDWINY